MNYRIFRKNNYFILIDDANNYHEDVCTTVRISKDLLSDTTYKIQITRPNGHILLFDNVTFAQILDETGSAYGSTAIWEDWYSANTGDGASLSDLVTSTTGVEKTPTILRTSAAGTIPGNPSTVSVYNAGDDDGTFIGETIKAGESLNFDAGSLQNTFATGVFTYDGTGTELLIIYIS